MKATTNIIWARLLSAFPFGIFYASLQLYLTSAGFSTITAINLVGITLSLSYTLSLVGGKLLAQKMSCHHLLLLSIIFQSVACLIFMTTNHNAISWCLASFLLGSTGINVSLNMLLTNQFSKHDNQREHAFFWFYMSINICYLLAYLLSGMESISPQHTSIITILAMSMTLSSLFFLHKVPSFSQHKEPKTIKPYHIASTFIALLIGVRIILNYASLANTATLLIWSLSVTWLYIKLQHKMKRKELHMFYLFLILTTIFWSVYFISPMLMMLYIKNHVQLQIGNIFIAPQWLQNTNTIIVIFGSMALGLRKPTYTNAKILRSFNWSLFYLAGGLALLVIGIKTAPSGKLPFYWIILSYVLQSIGELHIGPIGFSLVGRFIPQTYQSYAMGIWVTILGVALSISSKLSTTFVPETHSLPLAYTKYQSAFSVLTFSVLAIALILLLLSKLLKKFNQISI